MSQTLEESQNNYKNGYYKNKLEEGLEYQDIVTRLLYQRGIVIVGYSSKKFQNNAGENMLGAEIKRDGNFRKTGNLYIETAEKSHPDKPVYTISGIHRDDNSWLYVIGDELLIYIFAKKYLKLLQNRYKQVETPTSKGFLIPLIDADKYSINKIDMGAA